jgi:hypothetical protein
MGGKHIPPQDLLVGKSPKVRRQDDMIKLFFPVGVRCREKEEKGTIIDLGSDDGIVN